MRTLGLLAALGMGVLSCASPEHREIRNAGPRVTQELLAVGRQNPASWTRVEVDGSAKVQLTEELAYGRERHGVKLIVPRLAEGIEGDVRVYDQRDASVRGSGVKLRAKAMNLFGGYGIEPLVRVERSEPAAGDTSTLVDAGLGVVTDGFIARYGRTRLAGQNQDRLWFRYDGPLKLLGEDRNWFASAGVNRLPERNVYRAMAGYFPLKAGEGDFLRLIGTADPEANLREVSALFIADCLNPAYLLFADHDNSVFEPRNASGGRGIVPDPTEYRVKPFIEDVARSDVLVASAFYRWNNGKQEWEARGFVYPASAIALPPLLKGFYIGGGIAGAGGARERQLLGEVGYRAGPLILNLEKRESGIWAAMLQLKVDF